MLLKHSHTIAMINRDRAVKYLLRDYFGLPRMQSLMPAFLGAGLGQADIVLALLHLRDQCHTPYRRIYSVYITLLVGRPIQIGERCLLRYVVNGHPLACRASDGTDRRIAYVAKANPRAVNTPAAARWREVRVGRTVAQLLVRGVTRRDVRQAVRNGWIRLEEQVAA